MMDEIKQKVALCVNMHYKLICDSFRKPIYESICGDEIDEIIKKYKILTDDDEMKIKYKCVNKNRLRLKLLYRINTYLYRVENILMKKEDDTLKGKIKKGVKNCLFYVYDKIGNYLK